MKKLVVFIMLLVLSLTCFAACNTTPADKAESLERAATYLNQMYKGEPKETPADYEVVKQVRIGERTIAVTWEVEVLTEGVPADSVKVVVNPDRSITIDVNEETPVAIEYLLKGTVSNSINSITKTFERVIPQYIPALTPVEGEEYHFAFLQGNNNFKAYYLTGALSGYYLETSNDPTKAAKVSIENTEGGFYIVVTVNGNKTYLNTTLALKDASNPEGGYNRNFSFDATPITVYEYASEFRAVKMLLSDEANDYAVYYCLGTYSSYTTGSASELRYLSSTNVDVSQFPFHFFATDADLSVFEKVEEEKPDDPVADKKVTISEFNAIAEALGENNKTTTEKYIIRGKVTEIKNTTYGNMYIQDENGVSAYIYGLYNADGTVRFDAMEVKPAVGDTITVVGVASYYNGAQMKNAWLYEEEGEKDEIISIAEFNAIADALGENNKTTEEKYIISGKVTEIKNTTYGNMYIEDENGDKAYLYGLYSADGSTRFDAMEVKPAVGDTITVIGVACYYNGPQMKNAWLYEAAEDDGTISLTEFNAIADALGENNKTTEEKYTIKGKVTEIKSETYGNMYIEDESGAKVYIYGIYSADGSTRYDAMEVKPAVGDTIIVTGVACYYNGPQMKNGWVLEIVGAETPDDPENPEVLDTPEKIVNAAYALETGATLGTYTLTGVVTEHTEYSTQYNNLTVVIVVGDMTDKPITCFRIKGSEIANVKVGDTITVTGSIINYNGTIEFNAGSTLDSLVAGETPEQPEQPSAETATISFADTANRTVLTTEQQVWVQNGITVTGNKDASSNNVADYSDPARFYKGSTIIISAEKNIEKIVITCSGSKYYLTSATVTGGTLASDGATATITCDGTANSVTLSALGNQVRIASIEVTLVAGGSSEPEHTCNFTDLTCDATHHWYACECGEISEKEAHKGGTATTTEQARCEVCDTPYGELAQPEVPTDSVVETYNWADYEAGVQYAEETHKLSNNVDLYSVDCHFRTDNFRMYNSSNSYGVRDSIAILKSTTEKNITSVTLNVGNKATTLTFYGSNDNGATWTEIKSISVLADYADHTISGFSYKWVKMDVTGELVQIRIASLGCTLQA